jgi:hypothetical protein
MGEFENSINVLEHELNGLLPTTDWPLLPQSWMSCLPDVPWPAVQPTSLMT